MISTENALNTIPKIKYAIKATLKLNIALIKKVPVATNSNWHFL